MAEDAQHLEIVTELVEGPDEKRRQAQWNARNLPGEEAKALRELLIAEIPKHPDQRGWGPRAWLLETLGQIAGSDEVAEDLLLQYLAPSHESVPEVRFWALSGLVAGAPDRVDMWLEYVASDDSPLVRALSEVLRARGDVNVLRRIRSDLESADPRRQEFLLRALRVVPIDALWDVIERLAKFASDPVVEKQANKALAVMSAGAVSDSELREAAESGNAQAMVDLAARLRLRDEIDEAESWLHRAAEEENPAAMLTLGLLNKEQGELADAEKWLRMAAKLDEPEAMHNLATLLEDRDESEEAEEWYEQAASLGYEEPDRTRDYVRWRGDEAAIEDELQRRPVARVLAGKLQEVCEDPATPTFLVHVDGPWGSGKTTLLGFLKEELDDAEPPWLVVQFNAWRQSQAGPAWWALLHCLRQAIPSTRRRWLSLWFAERLQLLGPMYLTGAVFLAGVVGLVVALAAGSNVEFGLGSVPEAVKSLGTALSVLAVLWSGGMALFRVAAWGSPRGARIFKDTRADAMGDLASHFEWLTKAADQKRIIFFIDDLDRCEKEFVVNLLDAVQTLARRSPRAHSETRETRNSSEERKLFFLVASDGRWIRKSFEIAHQEFVDAVGQPGRPLGYLFLDKLFQLTVPVPLLSPDLRQRFMDALLASKVELVLSVDDSDSTPSVSDDAIQKRIRRGRTMDEVDDALRDATEGQRVRLGGFAAEQLLRADITAEGEHVLSQYADMVDPNPRSMKRFLLAYSMLKSLRLAEGTVVARDTLARWTILWIRWPELAAALSARPQAVNPPAGTGKDELGELRALLESREVAAVTSDVLDEEAIRDCCGLGAGVVRS